MDKKTIESNIEKFSQINNSIIKQASSVQSKWEARLIEAKTGALREMREAINVIANAFKEDNISIPFSEMWEFDLNVEYSWTCDDSTQAKVKSIELVKTSSDDICIEVIVENLCDSTIKNRRKIDYFKRDDIISMLSYALQYLKVIVLSPEVYKESCRIIKFIPCNKQKLQIMEEWKIGEIRQIDNEWYQCLESSSCRCDYCDYGELGDCHKIACASGERSDDKEVYFKKLKKVGKPYEHYEKFYQCYKLPMETEIRLLPNNCYPIGKDNLVEIEIKQKEDMEEKKIKLSQDDIDWLKKQIRWAALPGYITHE